VCLNNALYAYKTSLQFDALHRLSFLISVAVTLLLLQATVTVDDYVGHRPFSELYFMCTTFREYTGRGREPGDYKNHNN